MSSFRPLTPTLSVSPQITEADIAQAAAQGFRTLINNRPDGEEPGQLTAARAREVAQAAGLTYVYLPVDSHSLLATVDAFGEVLDGVPGPVLAHCRSGTRSTMLWALSTAKRGGDAGEILAATAAQGYDLSPYAALLTDLSARSA